MPTFSDQSLDDFEERRQRSGPRRHARSGVHHDERRVAQLAQRRRIDQDSQTPIVTGGKTEAEGGHQGQVALHLVNVGVDPVSYVEEGPGVVVADRGDQNMPAILKSRAVGSGDW